MSRHVGYIDSPRSRCGDIHAFESNAELVDELRRGMGNDFCIYAIHSRNQYVHCCRCGAHLVSRARTDVVCWQVPVEGLGAMGKIRSADEDVHNSEMLWF